jgi:hypothetical protein
MDSIDGDKTMIYANAQRSANVNPKVKAKKERDDRQLEKKLRLANLSDDEIELASRQKAYKDYKNDSTRIAAGMVGATIPLAFSLASGIRAKGSAARKTAVAATSAKNWGIALTAGLLFSKAAGFVLGSDDSSKKVAKDHPVTTLGTIVAGAAAVGVAAIHYTDKLFTKFTGNKLNEKIEEKVENFSPLKNKTFEEHVEKAANFLEHTKQGHYIKQGALIGTAILATKPFLDCTKVDKNVQRSKEELERKRYEASRDLANNLYTKRNEPNPFKTEVQGVIFISSKN